MMRSATILTTVVFAAMFLFACSGKRPASLGLSHGALASCPASPNCVSSDSVDKGHGVAPFQLSVAAGEAWSVACKRVSALPRTRVVTETPDYLHAECRSAFFRFVDDIELHLRPAAGIIAVRSASRLGYSDMGVNRNRIENLRRSLIRQGVVK